MADLELEKKVRDVAMALADDAADAVTKLRKSIRSGQYERAAGLAAGLQRAARDAKWLMQRQPKN